MQHSSARAVADGLEGEQLKGSLRAEITTPKRQRSHESRSRATGWRFADDRIACHEWPQ
jgi:hypothetical protein